MDPARERAHRIAAAQGGLITRRQARAVGLTPDAIRYALTRSNRWHRVLPGIYLTTGGPLLTAQRVHAGLLHGGPASRLTGGLACRLLGLDYGPGDDGFVDVVVPAEVDRQSIEFVRIHRTLVPIRFAQRVRLHPAETNTPATFSAEPRDRLVQGIGPTVVPSVTPARAVIDSACAHSRGWATTRAPRGSELLAPLSVSGRPLNPGLVRDVRALLCEAVQRGQCSVADLEVELDEHNRRGTAAARVALVDLAAGCRSAPECELRGLVSSSRVLPEPRWNEPLPGGELIPDACWLEARLIVEVDSRSWHGFGDAPERTERRRARLAALGWTVLPVSPHRLRQEPAAVLAEIEAAYLAGVAEHPLHPHG